MSCRDAVANMHLTTCNHPDHWRLHCGTSSSAYVQGMQHAMIVGTSCWHAAEYDNRTCQHTHVCCSLIRIKMRMHMAGHRCRTSGYA